MDITRSVVSERERALLSGDYATYHAQATRRIHNIRKRLGIANPKGRKYVPKAAVTAENVTANTEWVHLLLASAERAWADAMAMKASQAQETTQKPMPGSTKHQIISRLRRAITYAQNLTSVLEETAGGKTSDTDMLEATAYLHMLLGSRDFEKSRWSQCLANYSLVRIVYTALGETAKTDLYKDLLSSIVEPSVRYSAYQLKFPRTKPIQDIAVESFPSSQAELKKKLVNIAPQAFQTTKGTSVAKQGAKDAPSHVTWRARKVRLEDATISSALAIAQSLETTLNDKFDAFSKERASMAEISSAYDDVITSRQDAADATKSAIDDLASEGIDTGDSRMQSLQITRTAVNYGVIEYRVGRNRVLCGTSDGLDFAPMPPKQPLKPTKEAKPRAPKQESVGRQLSRLRERVTLYDSTIQSIDSIKELPGVIADTDLVAELDAKHDYFRALRCLAVGRCYAIQDQIHAGLAMFNRAHDLAGSATASNTPSAEAGTAPKLELTQAQSESLVSTLKTLVTQYRALVELRNITSESHKATRNTAFKTPLLETLHLNTYSESVDLSNLVNYPPTLRPIPVKPLFFDLAWNYIQYPGHTKKGLVTATANGAEEERQAAAEPKKSRGWFGFGRS